MAHGKPAQLQRPGQAARLGCSRCHCAWGGGVEEVNEVREREQGQGPADEGLGFDLE